ncbi:hypothetical protein A3709_06910 [Halioglobus sp. HI00S01]|uniref:UPF0149 family protein n=1 Tax=Halioglobus sp. HI00S01 TaxID=1822214 RepID=UPI0007C35D08|nr:UPF0149 family protein [Halioglobus sp. HI00S01]KZX56109.1 hypothetical protein A3709_06910 [Halioglobus sp. HI00S01]
MFDDHDSANFVFDFDEVANHLLEQGLDSSPSQLHGCLCGVLAAGAPAQAEAGLALLQQALDINLHGELAGQIMQLYMVSAAALEDEEFDFHPLLPDDEVEIDSRTGELARWCQGFLAGFAQVNQRQVSQDSSEILSDMGAIAEASVDEDADEEESEGSYTEIVEYLRFAVLNLFMDSRADGTRADEPQVH